MGKGLGIAALVIAICAIPIPIVGVFLAWLSLVIAAFAGFAGQVPLAVSVVAVSAVNIIFLSPTLWLGTIGANMNPGPASPNIGVYVSIIAILAPIVAIGLRAFGLASTTTITTGTTNSDESVRPRRLPDR